MTFTVDDPDHLSDDPQVNGPKFEIQRRKTVDVEDPSVDSCQESWEPVWTVTVVQGTSIHSYVAREQDEGCSLRAVVTYTDRLGPGKMAISGETVPVTKEPLANAPPRLIDSILNVDEDASPGSIVGQIDAVDREGDTITFRMLNEDDYRLFRLSSNGQLRTAQALDYETLVEAGRDFYRVTFTMSDGKGVDADNNEINDNSVDVTEVLFIYVRDVEEPGVHHFLTPVAEGRGGADSHPDGRRRRDRGRVLAVGEVAGWDNGMGQHPRRNVRHLHAGRS